MSDVQTNVIIDGMNIAFRCSYIYDRKQQLTASDGSPTGTIYGFARHMVKLRDRFPGANFYVAWEGRNSRQERREIYADYKGNRPDKSDTGGSGESEKPLLFEQLDKVGEVLEAMGVHQVVADGYEADDVIATLIRERFSAEKYKNIVVSSDRDLLQLVGPNTVFMTPQSEKFYDRHKVVEEYGVPPELLLAYRTFDGDTSDNLPRPPRFPKKKIAALVKAHDGDVESIYTDCAVDLTDFQRTSLDDFEEQAYINHKVMALRTVDDYELYEGEHDEDTIGALCDQLEIESIRADLLSFTAKTGFVKTGTYVGTFHSTS
jgi:DNA polymerase-1